MDDTRMHQVKDQSVNDSKAKRNDDEAKISTYSNGAFDDLILDNTRHFQTTKGCFPVVS